MTILWVKKQAAGAACDQRACVERVEGFRIYVTLLGTDEPAIVMPDEICGVEVGDGLTIRFNTDAFRSQEVK